MPVPMKVRGPRPPAVSTAVTAVVPPRRPDTRGALDPGPADVVRAQALVGNAAVSAVMGGLPRGKEPSPDSWAARQLLTGQRLVGNQAVANRGLPGPPERPAPVPAGKKPPVPADKKPPAPVAQNAKPAAADRKPEPDKSTVDGPDKRAPK